MKTEVSIKTRTTVDKAGNFSITSFSDKNEDGSTTPELFKSEILNDSKTIDNVKGKEGELLLSHDSEFVGDINSNGDLVLNIENDNLDKYNKQDENLIYG